MAILIRIGDRVQRNQVGDYTHGRRGDVVDINGERLRVKWDMFPSGVMMKTPVRTWVNVKRLVKIG